MMQAASEPSGGWGRVTQAPGSPPNLLGRFLVASGPYARLYYSIVDDLGELYDDNDALAEYVRSLLEADAAYPMSPPLPSKQYLRRGVRLLLAAGWLIRRNGGRRYSVKGLEAERERRSGYGRNAAAMRWQSGRNTDAMPRRDETRRDKHISANASTEGLWHHGQHPRCSTCEQMRANG